MVWNSVVAVPFWQYLWEWFWAKNQTFTAIHSIHFGRTQGRPSLPPQGPQNTTLWFEEDCHPEPERSGATEE